MTVSANQFNELFVSWEVVCPDDIIITWEVVCPNDIITDQDSKVLWYNIPGSKKMIVGDNKYEIARNIHSYEFIWISKPITDEEFIILKLKYL